MFIDSNQTVYGLVYVELITALIRVRLQYES